MRTLKCAIEQVAEWHPGLFLESHIVACAAVLAHYSASPATIAVECENVASRWLGEETSFRLKVTWRDDTTEKAERLRRTIQAKPLVEMASVTLALILVRRAVRLGELDVTEYGERTDFRSLKTGHVLEISGTEVAGELGRRHREKVTQAMANPSGAGIYVVVCSFAARGHRIRMSGHGPREAESD